ncbi:MAG: restriction endonuclease subunit S [Pseudomonadota bacterium]
MSFPRYPEYKDSGVEWLGDVPAHWGVVRVKNLLRRMGSGGTPDTQVDGHWTDEGNGIRWVAIGDMSGRDVVSDTEKRITEAGAASKGLDVWPEGTLLFSMYASLGHVAELSVPAAINQAILALQPDDDVSQSYLKRWFEYLRPSLKREASSNTQDNLNAEKVRNLVALRPPLIEQRAIARYLGRELQKVDALISEQERLIALLKEKRHAVISHAVTKGLDPNVPMKDSGIEWLGEVPAHWGVVQSRRLFRVRSERALDGDQMLTASQKYGVLYQSEFVELEGRRVVEVIKGVESLLHAEPDDFVISMRSFQGGIEWCRLRGSISFHYVMLVPVKHVHPPFFSYLFKSMPYIQALRSTTDLIRDGQELRYSHFVQVPIPIIPMAEQEKIAEFLVDKTVKMDALIDEAGRAVVLLREHRAALISAAVTGKIDVRQLNTTEAA